jgi:hypothetical protein
VRRHGHGAEAAQHSTQAFFIKLVEKGYSSAATMSRRLESGMSEAFTAGA